MTHPTDQAAIDARAFQAGKIAGESVGLALREQAQMLRGLFAGLAEQVGDVVPAANDDRPFRMNATEASGVALASSADWRALRDEIKALPIVADVQVNPMLTTFFATLLVELPEPPSEAISSMTFGEPQAALKGGKLSLHAVGEVEPAETASD